MKTRIPVLFIILLIHYSALAQRTIPPTDSLQISGKIKSPKTFSLAQLDTFPKIAIKDQVIYNHKGEAKDTFINMKGIPLKTVLASIEYIYDKPKALNEFYFVFTGSEGYKVVFSWNEIYNTEAGNNFFIVTELNGKKGAALDKRILFLSAADLKTGRRCIKGLSKIEVKQVE